MPGQTTFRGSLRVFGVSSAVGTLNVQPAEPSPLLAFQVDGSPSVVAQPRGGVFVTSGIEVYVGGVLVPLPRMLGPWSVKLTMEAGQNLQEWSFSTSVLGGVGASGSSYTQACAFGAASVDIYGVYMTPNGPARYPLITGGIGDNTQRVGSLSEGYYETHNGTCILGRFDGIPVTWIEPEGAGRSRDRIIADVFGEVGMPIAFALAAMHQVHKELQFVDAMPIAVAQELADVEARRIVANVRGELSNPQATARFGYGIAARFEEGDLLAAIQVETLDHQAVVTDVTLVSSQAIVQPPGSPDSGRVVSPLQETDIFGPVAIGNATYEQASDGSLVTLSGGGPILVPDGGLKMRTASQTETQYGATVRQTTYVELYRWLQAARYEWASGGVLDALASAWLDGSATAHGTEPAYGEPTARWRRDSETVETTYYDTDDLAGPIGHSTAEPWGYRLAGNSGLGSTRSDRKLGSISVKRGWYLSRLAVKQAVAGTAWEAVDAIPSRKVLGNGEGVGDGEETYQDVQWIVQTLEGDEDGALKVQTTWTLGFTRPSGGAWWFQTTGPSAVETEVWGVVSQAVVTYAAISSSAVQVVTARFDSQGQPAGDVQVEIKAGAPPQIEQLQRPTVGADGSLTTGQSQQIKVRVVAGNLEVGGGGAHLKKMLKTTVAFPESIDELADIGTSIIEQSAAGSATFATMANFPVTPGMFVHLTDRPIGLDADMQVITVTHSGVAGAPSGQPALQPATSAWTCARYPLIATGGG